jgi:hypothetical protein
VTNLRIPSDAPAATDKPADKSVKLTRAEKKRLDKQHAAIQKLFAELALLTPNCCEDAIAKYEHAVDALEHLMDEGEWIAVQDILECAVMLAGTTHVAPDTEATSKSTLH